MDTTKFNKEIESLRAEAVNSGSELHPLIKENIKQRVLNASRAEAETKLQTKRFTGQERRNNFMKYIISTLLGLSLLGGTALAAQNSKPGDILFPIKKAQERIAVSFAASAEQKAALEAKFANNRLEELNQIQAQAKADVQVQAEAKAEKNGKKPAVKAKAEAEAKAEVKNAINVLTQVRANLEAKGNATAASSVGETLLKLKAKENEDAGANVNVDVNEENHGRQNGAKTEVNASGGADNEIKAESNSGGASGVNASDGANLGAGAGVETGGSGVNANVNANINAGGNLNSGLKIK